MSVDCSGKVVESDSPEEVGWVGKSMTDGVATDAELCGTSIDDSGADTTEEAALVEIVSEGSNNEVTSLATLVLDRIPFQDEAKGASVVILEPEDAF